jgi:gliding motility-associated-like protein
MCRVNFPTSFSPGSKGEINSFTPEIQNASAAILFNMIISDQDGEVVFETYNSHSGWDGTYKGVQCPVGSYQYSATILETDKHPSLQFQKKGIINLIR